MRTAAVAVELVTCRAARAVELPCCTVDSAEELSVRNEPSAVDVALCNASSDSVLLLLKPIKAVWEGGNGSRWMAGAAMRE